MFSILLSACEFDKFVYFRICQNVTNIILAVSFTMQQAGQTGGYVPHLRLPLIKTNIQGKNIKPIQTEHRLNSRNIAIA